MLPSDKNRLSRQAFSLLEILTAVSVIAILVALLLPAADKFKASAQATKCASNLRNIFVGSEAWSADNNGRIVPVYEPSEGIASSLRNWTGKLAPYLGRTSTADFESARDMPVFTSPLHPQRFGFGYNYAYLSWVQSSKNIERWVTKAGVSKPSQTVFLVTNRNAGSTTDDFLSWRSYVRPPSISTITDYVVAFDYPGETARVLWLDGHVSSETQQTLMADDSLWDRE